MNNETYKIIYAGRCWIIAYTSFSPEVDHWECQEEEEAARRRYLELLNSGNWDIVSLTAVIESSDYETHPKFLVKDEPVIMTKEELYMNQAPSFNFEKNADELLHQALLSGFVDQVGPDQYVINMKYPEERES